MTPFRTFPRSAADLFLLLCHVLCGYQGTQLGASGAGSGCNSTLAEVFAASTYAKDAREGVENEMRYTQTNIKHTTHTYTRGQRGRACQNQEV